MRLCFARREAPFCGVTPILAGLREVALTTRARNSGAHSPCSEPFPLGVVALASVPFLSAHFQILPPHLLQLFGCLSPSRPWLRGNRTSQHRPSSLNFKLSNPPLQSGILRRAAVIFKLVLSQRSAARGSRNPYLDQATGPIQPQNRLARVWSLHDCAPSPQPVPTHRIPSER